MTFPTMRTITACLILHASAIAQSPDEVRFARDVQPLLARHCYECHGPDSAEAGLRLDDAELAVKPLESGSRAIVAGRPDASELLRRVTATDPDERMPPDGPPLTARDIALLHNWIAAGAKFERHWAYQSVAPPQVPSLPESPTVRNDIDRFIQARLQQAGLPASPEADRATLIKRLYYDLIGLPPTPTEVDAFVSDSSPEAWETLVDRLMQSDHFGERWGRHWLDKARYADSDGYEKDRPRPNAWRYRDWVINAINADMPFDEFTIEQLAGDLLRDADPQQKLATAFHRQTLTNTEGGTDQEQFRVEATFDRTETTAAVWMGLTLTCARCHSHKYDRITQDEYYGLYAFFNRANEANAQVARSPAAMRQYNDARAKHDAKLAELQNKIEQAKKELKPAVDAWITKTREAMSREVPLRFTPLSALTAQSASGAQLETLKDASVLVSGPTPDKDAYTLTFELPAGQLSGIRLEVLSHSKLPGKGPGRAPNGNFVLSELKAQIGSDKQFKESEPVKFVAAVASFTQKQFSPNGVLSAEERFGWAIAPRMGRNHTASFYLAAPQDIAGNRYLRIELDQQYGGAHTIGCFRISAITGFDPLRALPEDVAKAVRAKSLSPSQRSTITNHVARQTEPAAALLRNLAALRKRAPQSPLMSVRVMAPAERETRLLHRGDFLQPADKVTSSIPHQIAVTHPLKPRDASAGPDRLDLARWLVHERHPLTARVTVNHIWAHLFGRGLVPTVNDFGVRGDLPTHPQLLDYLAWQFPRKWHWSRKRLIREIVLSHTYRQSSVHRADIQQRDPTNRLFARQNRVRVEAEIVRDLYLAAAGLLSRTIGGPSVFPPLPPGVAELSYANNFKWKTSEGADRYRRGMYTFFKRTSPHPTLISFDCPDSNTTRLRRETSNTPLQALAGLNNEVFTEAAQAMARRVLAERQGTDRDRLAYALRLCIAREPSSPTLDRYQRLLDASREWYAAHPSDATALCGRHAATDVAVEESAAWVATVRMILNLDEFIVRD